MLLSMTGYGRDTITFEEKTIQVEIRTLNSKFPDLRMKIPTRYKEKEADLRKTLSSSLVRGKIDLLIEVKSDLGIDEFSLNTQLFRTFYDKLAALADELGMEKKDMMNAILRLPNVISPADGTLEDDEWEAVHKCLKGAIANLTKYRSSEGEAMQNDLKKRINNIIELLVKLPEFEKERILKLRNRLNQNLNDYLGKENVDENRFEQEVLFYLEKIDITEEKVRLKQHCLYFLEQMGIKNSQIGRKLNFISQEIGREINTLGAKAYSSDIQKCVVMMKDELEKVKEQVANIV